MTKFILPLLSALVCLSLPPAPAQFEAAGEKSDPVLIYRQAGASPEQESQIRKLAEEYERSARVRVERVRNLSRELKDLSYAPELDEKKILATQDEMNTLNARVSTERIKLMIDIRNILSAEQKEKLVELMKEKRSEGTAGSTAKPISP